MSVMGLRWGADSFASRMGPPGSFLGKSWVRWGSTVWCVGFVGVHGFAKYWRVKSCRRVNLVTLGMASRGVVGWVGFGYRECGEGGWILGRKYDEFYGVLVRRVWGW